MTEVGGSGLVGMRTLLHGALALARPGRGWEVLSPETVLSQCFWKSWVWLSGLGAEPGGGGTRV